MGEVAGQGFEFTCENFGKRVSEEFPSLKETMEEWYKVDLCHVQMSDFYFYAERAALDGDQPKLQRCITFIERVFATGDAHIVDAVHASFFEYISEDSVMYNALTPKLRKAWDLAWRETK